MASWITVPSRRLYCKFKRHAKHHQQDQLILSSKPSKPPSRPQDNLFHPLSSRSSSSSSLDMPLTNLPYTVFSEIVSYLSVTDVLICKRISTDISKVLNGSELSISLISLHYPRSLEGRTLRRYIQNEDNDALDAVDWAAVFAVLARRYVHLESATPWRKEEVKVFNSPALRGVTPWNKFLRMNQSTSMFHYWDPVWTYSPAQGVLVYPAEDDGNSRLVYRLRDSGTGMEFTVPFETVGKVIRRIRLSHGILIFEWCEERGYLSLNERETAHRHFITAYDVCRTPPGCSWAGIMPARSDHGRRQTSSWSVTFRSEWKMHSVGLPLSHRDRFFSTHNRTHYAVYIWQPTRSPWAEHGPLQQLIIWEIGDPLAYRPSLDPSGTTAPDPAAAAAAPAPAPGPRIIQRLVNQELSNRGILRRNSPCLRALALDDDTWDAATQSACGHVFFHEEEHHWSAGPHSSEHTPRQHHVLSTGMPLLSDGPVWADECGGSNRLQFCRIGPRKIHKRDRIAFNLIQTSIEMETWPGRAPCWRHDDFPFLTLSAVYDAEAGVRFSARRCFMMELLSVHTKPQLCVKGVDVALVDDSSSSSGGSSSEREPGQPSHRTLPRPLDSAKTKRRRRRTRSLGGPYGKELHFKDSLWDDMMGKGYMCGDERWLVWENRNGDVTILSF
ncbi:hypothetical protein QQS21_008371 [Conoideocrella luteorostrata]|uniref:F-box domain-containing protein n=1 Tax=Conoideocrella luteorostrata TaxID=1105319 RepID=A0AAJ0FW21_9HYPO|nr:hypothetical protein QQS21_008371 [Conoideocrella luteorostrata]